MESFVQLINLFLESRIDYNQFYSQFNELYFGNSSEDRNRELKPEEADLLDEINERMFLAVENPSEKEKSKYKYIDEKEFLAWLRIKKDQNIIFWR